ncbi:MAG: glycosyltransferase family 4 protein [Candidatus Hydrothermarchaeales archaeon]
MIFRSKLNVEWDSYEMPSYGFPEFVEKKKYGIVGGLGVVSDEVLSRISSKVNIFGVGMRHLRGRDLPVYEEIDGYKVFRPLVRLTPDEAIARCRKIFADAGSEFNGIHAREVPYLQYLSEYGLAISEIRSGGYPDLICGHDWMAILGSFEKAKRYGVPFVAFLHSLESGRQNGIIHTHLGPKEARYDGFYAGSRTIRDIEAIGLKKSDVCFTVGLNMVEELKNVGKMHGIPVEDIEGKVYPIHHGVDTRTYRPLGNLDKEYDAIFIGRFSPVKGAMELIDAIEILKHRYPDIKLKMIGGGELERDIEERIKREDLGANIEVSTRWHQNYEKCEEINKARIAIAPSKYEPHGQYDLEAGACGVPCINGTGGFMERMIDDVTALQCDPFDPRDIAEKIEYLLSKPEKAREIGRNAREFIAKYYDWDERAKIYPKVFEAIVDGDLRSLDDIPLVVSLQETEFALPTKKARAY